MTNRTLEERIDILSAADNGDTSPKATVVSVATQTEYFATSIDSSISEILEKERKILLAEREQLDEDKRKFSLDVDEVNRLKNLLADEQRKVALLKQQLQSLSGDDNRGSKSASGSPRAALPLSVADASQVTAEDISRRLESAGGLSTLM